MLLTEGPLHPRHGPYIRNIQLLENGIYLVEAQRGLKGTGKTWYPYFVNSRHESFGEVKPEMSQCRLGQFKLRMWGSRKARPLLLFNHNDLHVCVEVGIANARFFV